MFLSVRKVAQYLHSLSFPASSFLPWWMTNFLIKSYTIYHVFVIKEYCQKRHKVVTDTAVHYPKCLLDKP